MPFSEIDFGFGSESNNEYFVIPQGVAFNGTTDDTGAWQNNLAIAQPGTTFLFPGEVSLISGPLSFPKGVNIQGGAGSGPFSPTIAPTTITSSPTFLVTGGAGNSAGTPTITLQGNNTMADIAFYYPQQVLPSASTPTPYPWAVKSGAFCNFYRTTFINAYQGLWVASGGNNLDLNNFGCFSQDLLIDGAADEILVRGNQFSTFWDVVAALASGAQPIDTWVQANRIAIQVGRSDETIFSDNSIFFCNVGYDIINGADNTHISSKGIVTNQYMENMNTFVRASTTSSVGWQFSNTTFEVGQQQNGFIILNSPAAGYPAPQVLFRGGNLSGGHMPYKPTVNAGALFIKDVFGYNPIPQSGITTPAVPLTGVNVVNSNPSDVFVSIFPNGATITSVDVSNIVFGPVAPGPILVPAGQPINLVYTGGPPTWIWYGT